MTRRDFIEDTAAGGVAFVACSISGGSGGVEAQTRRREVVVSGKRVKTDRAPTTLLGVSFLGYPDQLVEIEAIAVVSKT